MKPIIHMVLAFLASNVRKSWIIAGISIFVSFSSALTVQSQQADILKTKCEEFSGHFSIDADIIQKRLPADIKIAVTDNKATIRLYIMSNCENASLNEEDLNSPSGDFGLAQIAVDTQGPVGPAKEAKIEGSEFNMLVRYNYTLWSWVSGSKRNKLITSLTKANISAIPAVAIEILRQGNSVEGRLVEIDKKPVIWTENLSNPSYGRMKVGVQIDFFNGDQKMLVECLWPLDKEGNFNLAAPMTHIGEAFGKHIEGYVSGHTFMHDCTITLDGVK